MTEKCPICNNDAAFSSVIFQNGEDARLELQYDCPHCGRYQLPNSRVLDAFYSRRKDNSFLLRCYMNEVRNNNSSKRSLRLNNEELERISYDFPKTPEEKIGKLLTYVNSHTSFFGERVSLTPEVTYSINPSELSSLVNELSKEGFLNSSNYLNGNANVSITMKGIQYIKEQFTKPSKEKCFVAMWFNPMMDSIWEEVIKPACEETGYKPIRIDKEQFNDDINDHIVSEIKESYFVIADLTGLRGGVYYEAGFARGLGKEVILCCKEGYKIKIRYEGSRKLETEKGPHFDVNHLNTLYWKDDLLAFKQKLIDRILATVERGTYNFQNSK